MGRRASSERQHRQARQGLQPGGRVGPRPLTGKRRQKWHSGYRTKKLAEDALSELVNGVKTGTYGAKSKQTLGAYLEEWLRAIEPTVRPATHYSYARNLRLHVLPY